MNDMQGKTVIVTGGSSGIGKAIAVAMARRGARVVISGRQAEALRQVAEEIRAFQPEVLAVQGDVSNEEDCRHLVDETVNRFGGIDILVNNAGMSMRALFRDTELTVLKRLMDINFWGTVYCTKYALPYLLVSRGSVVGISSIAGMKGLPARTGYSASKFAMQGFLEALRIENLKTGLHVLVCCPGFTASNIRKTALAKDGTAQGESPRDEDKMMQPEEVAEALIRAIHRRKRTLVLTTQGKLTVLLNKFFPGWMDKQVFNHIAKEPDSPFV